MNKKDTYSFTREFDAIVNLSNKRMQIVKPYYYNEYYNNTETLECESVPAVEILMPEDRFYNLVEEVNQKRSDNVHWMTYKQYQNVYGTDWPYRFNSMIERTRQEERLRNSNPALKKAWDHYQLLLEMS